MSVPGSRSGRCSCAFSRGISRSVFLNACTRVPFVRISVWAEMQHGCEVKRRLQLRAATATTALIYSFSACGPDAVAVGERESRLVLSGDIYSRSSRHFWSPRIESVFRPNDFAHIFRQQYILFQTRYSHLAWTWIIKNFEFVSFLWY